MIGQLIDFVPTKSMGLLTHECSISVLGKQNNTKKHKEEEGKISQKSRKRAEIVRMISGDWKKEWSEFETRIKGK